MGALGSNHVLADQRGGGAACWRRAAVAAAALAVPLAAAGIAPPPASATGGYTVTATIPVAAGPRAVAVDAATHTVYVTNQGENGTVTVIDETTNTVIHTIPVGTFPTDVAVNLSTNTGERNGQSCDVPQLPGIHGQRRRHTVRAARRSGIPVRPQLRRRAAGRRQDQVRARPLFNGPIECLTVPERPAASAVSASPPSPPTVQGAVPHL